MHLGDQDVRKRFRVLGRHDNSHQILNYGFFTRLLDLTKRKGEVHGVTTKFTELEYILAYFSGVMNSICGSIGLSGKGFSLLN
jgi:hypothetical protein